MPNATDALISIVFTLYLRSEIFWNISIHYHHFYPNSPPYPHPSIDLSISLALCLLAGARWARKRVPVSRKVGRSIDRRATPLKRNACFLRTRRTSLLFRRKLSRSFSNVVLEMASPWLTWSKSKQFLCSSFYNVQPAIWLSSVCLLASLRFQCDFFEEGEHFQRASLSTLSSL